MGKSKEMVRFKKQSRWREVVRMFMKNKVAVVGMIVFIVILVISLCAGFIVDENLCYEVTGSQLEKPSLQHILGTDQIGRDYFARLLYGSRVSLLTAIGTTILSMILGALIGCACGYFGGWIDNVFMRFFDILNCIPGMLTTLVLVSILGKNAINIIYALTLTFTPAIARSMRAMVINLSDMEYIRCAKSYGTNNFTIIVRHVMPNAMGLLITNTCSAVASTILSASAFSFLGFGVQAPTPEWGALVSASKSYMRTDPFLTIIPGLAILITAASVNLMGDGLRDALDPRLRD